MDWNQVWLTSSGLGGIAMVLALLLTLFRQWPTIESRLSQSVSPFQNLVGSSLVIGPVLGLALALYATMGNLFTRRLTIVLGPAQLMQARLGLVLFAGSLSLFGFALASFEPSSKSPWFWLPLISGLTSALIAGQVLYLLLAPI